MPQVLFICVHTASRSQVAAALLEHHAFGKVSVRDPRDDIDRRVRGLLSELLHD